MSINIAIDGPAGAGKSTISEIVAAEMGYLYVNTGMLYRAVSLYIIENNISYLNIEKALFFSNISLKFIDNVQKVFINGSAVSDIIRTHEISMITSRISAVPAVRTYLLELQKNIAKDYNVIMDGRDIGTIVLPDADVKIFLTASVEKRAKRRFLEKSTCFTTYNEILKDVMKRDYQDIHRTTAPLRQAKNAVLVDNTELTLEQSAQEIAEIIKKKVNKV